MEFLDIISMLSEVRVRYFTYKFEVKFRQDELNFTSPQVFEEK